MPYPNEHSARLRKPSDFDSKTFRRTKGGKIYGSTEVPKSISIIWGKLKSANKPSDPPLPQALRFPKSDWTEVQARKWLKDNKVKYILFEPANGDEEKGEDMNKHEFRSIAGRVELEERGESQMPKIRGYAARYWNGDKKTQFKLADGVFERIEKGAFDEAIAKDDVRALFNHKPELILGRTTAGTLELSTTDNGLRYVIDPPPSRKDVVESIRRKDVTGSSFAFAATRIRWEQEGDNEIRYIAKVNLFDVGPVTYPAYEATSSSVRGANPWEEERSTWLEELANDIINQKQEDQADVDERMRRLRLLELETL